MLYPCFCTRKEIQAEIARAGGAPQGEDGPIYPGTCKFLSHEERGAKIAAGAVRVVVAPAPDEAALFAALDRR